MESSCRMEPEMLSNKLLGMFPWERGGELTSTTKLININNDDIIKNVKGWKLKIWKY